METNVKTSSICTLMGKRVSYFDRDNGKKIFITCVLALFLWNYFMVFYSDLLLSVMSWWVPLGIDFVIWILAFLSSLYFITRSAKGLIDK